MSSGATAAGDSPAPDAPTQQHDPKELAYRSALRRSHGTEDAIAEAELESAPSDLPPSPSRAVWEERLFAVAAVSAGGFLGANARYLAGLWIGERLGATFPWGTLLINVSGSLVLGFYLTVSIERFASRPTTRLFVATGFLGGYTTFSTFSFEVVQLLSRGDMLPAVAYVAASLVFGLIAAAAGMLAARGLWFGISKEN